MIRLEVKKIQPKKKALICIVHEGGLLLRGKGLEVKNKIINQSGLPEEDKKDLKKLAKLDIDWVALSFVNQASDVNQAREVLSGFNNHTKLIAKIERIAALKQLYWIIKASDGIMVARGDLALESGPGELTGLQKNIIKQTVKGKKIVITATQMMESMIHNPTPTRAEMTDVSNAVLDGTDAVMLSAESATGQFPVKTIEQMAAICIEAEKSEVVNLDTDFLDQRFERIDQAIALGALFTAHHLNATAIAALTDSGSTPIWMSRHNIRVPIVALTSRIETQRALSTYRNVRPFSIEAGVDRESALLGVEKRLKELGVAKSGDTIVLTIGEPMDQAGGTNTLKIVKVR